ncbi:MAG: ribbon-helix-helix protein, CopG family [bacterium]
MSQGTKYRAQILLEPEQHKKLAEIAAREGRSVSDVVREAVAEYVVTRTQESVREKRLRGLEEIKKFREEILKRRGGKPIEIDPVELIRQMREERGDELFNVVSNRG